MELGLAKLWPTGNIAADKIFKIHIFVPSQISVK